MPHPLESRDELSEVLELAAREARAYLETHVTDPVQPPGAEEALAELSMTLPDDGDGTLAPIRDLGRLGRATATRSSGPKFFHFVIGGTTPAALAADWL